MIGASTYCHISNESSGPWKNEKKKYVLRKDAGDSTQDSNSNSHSMKEDMTMRKAEGPK